MEIGKFAYPGPIPGHRPPSRPAPEGGTATSSPPPSETVHQGEVVGPAARPATQDYAELIRNARRRMADAGEVRRPLPNRDAVAAYRSTAALDPEVELLPRIDRFV